MGKRSRKQRSGGDGPAGGPTPATAPARRPTPRGSSQRFGERERPKAPWHPFPLVELCVLVGLVLIGIGFFSLDDSRGGLLIVCGLALASLAGLDTVVREHFAGFRSHTLLLAGVPTVAVAGVVYFARAPIIVLLVAAALVFTGGILLFRRLYPSP